MGERRQKEYFSSQIQEVLRDEEQYVQWEDPGRCSLVSAAAAQQHS